MYLKGQRSESVSGILPKTDVMEINRALNQGCVLSRDEESLNEFDNST